MQERLPESQPAGSVVETETGVDFKLLSGGITGTYLRPRGNSDVTIVSADRQPRGPSPLTSSREDSTAAPPGAAESGADSATGHAAEPSVRRSRFARFHNLQQRFEDSRNGRRVIVGLIVVILGVQILWNLPDSAIRQSVTPVIDPASLIGVTERWPMFSPNPTQRTEHVEVMVTMADGSTRTWTVEPYPPFKRVFVANRWLGIKETVIRQPEVRPELARWVVDEVTGPGEQPTKVVMTMRFERLLPPGQRGPRSPAERILYQEEFAKQP